MRTMNTNIAIINWKEFGSTIRPRGCDLLKQLDEFPESILISGCQRSGTTMLSRIITESDGMVNYWFGEDDELDAALILCGEVNHPPQGRYCFQTTFLNECYHEYFEQQNGHKLVWVLRNPYSVVYSMLYNWDRWALKELTIGCGTPFLSDPEKLLYKLFGVSTLSGIRQACYAYTGKTSQVFELIENLGKDKILLIEYDNLVKDKEKVLPQIYDFLSLQYKNEYADKIHKKSIQKAKNLSSGHKKTIDKICIPIYQKALDLCINK